MYLGPSFSIREDTSDLRRKQAWQHLYLWPWWWVSLAARQAGVLCNNLRHIIAIWICFCYWHGILYSRCCCRILHDRTCSEIEELGYNMCNTFHWEWANSTHALLDRKFLYFTWWKSRTTQVLTWWKLRTIQVLTWWKPFLKALIRTCTRNMIFTRAKKVLTRTIQWYKFMHCKALLDCRIYSTKICYNFYSHCEPQVLSSIFGTRWLKTIVVLQISQLNSTKEDFLIKICMDATENLYMEYK
jgi:hypothetical protein